MPLAALTLAALLALSALLSLARLLALLPLLTLLALLRLTLAFTLGAIGLIEQALLFLHDLAELLQHLHHLLCLSRLAWLPGAQILQHIA